MNPLARNWGWMALRGVAALIFGLVTLFNPAISLAVLVLLFGAYALINGVLEIVLAIANRRGEQYWGALLVGGILSAGIGVLTLRMPGVTALVLLYFIAAWALIFGVAELVAAIRLRRIIRHEWLLALAGGLSVIFGLLLLVFPGAGALTVILWIGAYATVLGILLILLALRLRSWQRGQARNQREA